MTLAAGSDAAPSALDALDALTYLTRIHYIAGSDDAWGEEGHHRTELPMPLTPVH